jgi:hypothetical protein
VARDVQFDERVLGLPSDDSDEEEDCEQSSPASGPTASVTSVPLIKTSNPLRRSSRAKKPTEKGAAWAMELAATQTRLQTLQEH